MTLKVYNDIAAELSMAVLKFLKRTKEPDEEIMYRCVNNDNGNRAIILYLCSPTSDP